MSLGKECIHKGSKLACYKKYVELPWRSKVKETKEWWLRMDYRFIWLSLFLQNISGVCEFIVIWRTHHENSVWVLISQRILAMLHWMLLTYSIKLKVKASKSLPPKKWRPTRRESYKYIGMMLAGKPMLFPEIHSPLEFRQQFSISHL